jgi:cobalamin-dependent methionine synthase I
MFLPQVKSARVMKKAVAYYTIYRSFKEAGDKRGMEKSLWRP